MSAPINQKRYGSFSLGHGNYQGEMVLEEGLYPNPHGYGVETAHFREFKGKYEHGEMKLGVMDHRDSGGIVTGTFGSASNHSVIEYANSTYKGQTQNCRPHGSGIMEYKNGDKYTGQFLNGLKNGYGVFVSGNNTIKGLWKENMLAQPM